jgi:hypothetical protein
MAVERRVVSQMGPIRLGREIRGHQAAYHPQILSLQTHPSSWHDNFCRVFHHCLHRRLYMRLSDQIPIRPRRCCVGVADIQCALPGSHVAQDFAMPGSYVAG